MTRTLLSLLVVSSLVAALARPAAADGWGGDDWLYGSLSAAAGGAGAGLAGGLVGSMLDTCRVDDPGCINAFTLAGAWSGLVLGSAAGVSWYGKRRGLRGSFRSAVVGAIVGNVASGSVIVLATRTIDEDAIGIPVVLGALIGLPALGATYGYKRSVGSHDPAPPSSVALLDVAPGSARLQVPAPSLVVTRRETVVMLPLAGGRF